MKERVLWACGACAAAAALYPLAQVEEKPVSMGGRGMTYKEAKDILRVAAAEAEWNCPLDHK